MLFAARYHNAAIGNLEIAVTKQHTARFDTETREAKLAFQLCLAGRVSGRSCQLGSPCGFQSRPYRFAKSLLGLLDGKGLAGITKDRTQAGRSILRLLTYGRSRKRRRFFLSAKTSGRR